MTALKHMSHRDDVKSSGPQEIEDSLCHSFPHFMHFTRNLFIAYTMLRPGSFCSLKRPWSFFKPRAGCITELSKKYQVFFQFIKTMTIAWGTVAEQGNPKKREQAVGYVINVLFHPVCIMYAMLLHGKNFCTCCNPNPGVLFCQLIDATPKSCYETAQQGLVAAGCRALPKEMERFINTRPWSCQAYIVVPL